MSDVTVDEVLIKFEGETTSLTSSMDKLSSVLDRIAGKLDNVTNKSKNNADSFSKISKAIKGLGLAAIFNKLTSSIGNLTNKSSEYIENLNLFYVSLGKNADMAKKFADNFSSALSVDPSKVYRYLGLFNSLIEGFGVSSDKAYLMSKNLTQLSYDFASFYNLPIEQAMQKLKSGISGEIEPMRAIGVALDQTTLQATAYSLGIKTLVSDMTRAQKTQLLYYQIMKSTSQQQMDMGRTLLSPANALRVTKEQFTLLGRAIGNIFIPMLVSILPYINYITQALAKLADRIAAIFGFKITNYVNSATDGIGNISSGIDNIGTGANKASKEIKKMLRDFDELHVIDFDTSKTGSSGKGSTGVSGDLNIPLPDYDATSGLVKNLDNVKEKMEFIKDLVFAIGEAIGVYFVAKKILDFASALGLVSDNLDKIKAAFGLALTLSGIYLQYKGIEKLLDGDISIYSVLETFLGTAAGTLGIVSLIGSTKAGKEVPLPNKIKIGAGIMIALAGFQMQHKGTEKLLDGDVDIYTILETFLGTAAGALGIVTLISGTKYGKVTSLLDKIRIGVGIMLLLQGLETELSGIQKGDVIKQILGALEIGVGAGMATGSVTIGLTVALAVTEIALIADMHTWVMEFKDKWKKELFGDKEDLNLFEWLDVGMTSIGEGAWKALGLSDADAKNIGTKVNDFFSGIETNIGTFSDNVETTFSDMGADIDNFFTDMPENVGNFLTDTAGRISQWGEDRKNDITGWFNDRISDITGFFDTVKNNVVQWFTDRKQDVEDFFTNLKNKAIETKDNMIDTVKGWKDGIVDKVIELKDKIKEKFEEIKTTIKDKIRGIPDWIKTNLVDKVKEKFQNIASAIGDFISGAVKGAINGAFSKVESWINGFINGINSAIDTINNIPGVSIGRINTISLPRFAEGGFPQTGSLFIANEAGPEWVGSMNGQTAVANSDQISEGVRIAAYQGMKQALSEAGLSPKIYVNIGNEKVYSGYGKQKKSDSNMYGVEV